MILLLVSTDKGPGIYLSESAVKFIISLKLFSKNDIDYSTPSDRLFA